MKTLSQFLSIVTLIAVVSLLQVNSLQAQRDHRSSNKTVKKVTVLPRNTNVRSDQGNDQIVEQARDHRKRPTIIAPNNRNTTTAVRTKVDLGKSKAGRTSFHPDSIKVSSPTSTQNRITSDNRTQPRKASIRDHRNDFYRGTPTTLKTTEKSKNYRLNAFGKFIPFTPPFKVNIPQGFVAKGLGHCVSIPCPEGFGDDTVCWRCTEPPAPKPSAPDTKATRN